MQDESLEQRARRLRRDAAAHRRFAKAVKERDGYRCQRCGSTERLIAHHVKPLQEGGTHHVDNGITLCGGCHGPERTSYEFKLVRSDGSPTRRVLMEAIDEPEEYQHRDGPPATAPHKDACLRRRRTAFAPSSALQ